METWVVDYKGKRYFVQAESYEAALARVIALKG